LFFVVPAAVMIGGGAILGSGDELNLYLIGFWFAVATTAAVYFIRRRARHR
jgi:hypothetical protein